MNEQDLLDLKHEIGAAKEKATELTGQQKTLMKQLLGDWDFKTIVQAEKKVGTMDNDITKLNDQITKGTEELEELIDIWDDADQKLTK